MNRAMTAQATRNETRKPVPTTSHWSNDRCSPPFKSEYADAAIIVGIARKNENSAATERDAPNSMAPMMVAADREVPGIMARH